jgi:hypothetical protein
MAASGNRGAGLVSLGLFSILASLVVARASSKPPPAATPPPLNKPAAAAKPPEPKVACEALAELEADQCSTGLRDFFVRNQLCAESSTVDTVVATLPDPSDSRLMSQSDQALAALVLAGETKAPLADFWLPWRDGKGATAAAKEGCHLRWPGAVVFQRVDEKDAGKVDRTLLLLAGELPTAGVHQQQLKRALQIAFETNPRRELDVIGPTFSGSAASMRPVLLEALKSAREEHGAGATIQVTTGSATDPRNKDVLTAAAAGLRFQATVASDDSVRAALYQYLADKRIAHLRKPAADGTQVMENVALLSEADTDYGNEAHGGGLQPAYQIKFPIHIADVRSAWEKEDAVREAASASVPQTAVVPVDLQTQSADPTDDLPTFSRLTAAYDERSLTASLAALEANGIEAVGIIATDVRDRLFLAEAIHRNAPDVQLFTFESDLLFAHPAYQDVMRGMIVASTYPLIPDNQVWSARTRAQETRPRQFGGSLGEGIYNAAVRAYGDTGLLADYYWPLVPGLSSYYEENSPPVWISVVGGQTLWPLRAVAPKLDAYLGRIGLPARDPKEPPPPPRPSPRIPEIGSPGSTAIILFCLLTLILCALAFATVNFRSYGTEALDGPIWLLHPRLAQPSFGRTLLCWSMLALAFALLFSGTWLLGVLAAAPEEFRLQMDPAFVAQHGNVETPSRGVWHFPRLFFCSLASAASVTAFLYALICRSFEQPATEAKPKLAAIPRVLPWIAMAVLFGFTYLSFAGIQACAKQIFGDAPSLLSGYTKATPGEGAFSFVRLINLDDSISLVVPTAALFVIVMLFAGNVCRTLFVDEWLRQRLQRKPDEQDGPWSGLAGFFDGRLTHHSFARIAGVCIYVGIPVVWVFHNVHGTLDGAWGFVFLPRLVALGTAVTLLGVAHMWLLWRRLGSWLEELADGPLHEALGKLKKEASHLVGVGTTMRIASAHGLEVLQRKTGREHEALRSVFAIGAAVTRLRGVWIRVSISTLLFLVTISVYPIHPHKQILVLGWFVVGSVVAATVWLFVEMSRNPALSLLSDTPPGEVTWNADFVQKLLTYAALPLLGLITAQFPDVASAVFSFVGPILQGSH